MCLPYNYGVANEHFQHIIEKKMNIWVLYRHLTSELNFKRHNDYDKV